IEDRQRSGRPSQVDEERLKQLVEADPHQTSSELAAVLGLSYRTVINHLHAIGKVNKLDQWVPHDLSDWDRPRRVEAAVSLLSFTYTTAWLSPGGIPGPCKGEQRISPLCPSMHVVRGD